MKKRSKRIIGFMIILVVMVLFATFLRIRANRKAIEEQALPDINMEYTVTRTDIGDALEVMGTVNAPERSIYGKISGEIQELFVVDHQSIEKDATIAVIDSTQYQLNYLQAKTAFENSLGGAPKTVEERLLSLQIAEENLTNTVIKSPVNGFIKNVPLHEGDRISANSVICTVVEDRLMYVESSIDEVDLKKVKVGQTVQFVFEPLDALKITGRVRQISPIAQSSSGIVVIPIEFSFDSLPKDQGVIPGLTCSVNILLMERTDIIVIPVLAVLEDEKGSYCYVKHEIDTKESNKKGGLPGEKRYLQIGQITENYVEIIDGLKEGEIVIIQPDEDRLREAMKELNPSLSQISSGGRS
ncbi:MAG TPA: efflux RND transporter periplasmic adaptor subunit [Thermotogota bacterium]|nr:efflux RND transporter periplasmic adaptor subunit [Thermotogota bacterium]